MQIAFVQSGHAPQLDGRVPAMPSALTLKAFGLEDWLQLVEFEQPRGGGAPELFDGAGSTAYARYYGRAGANQTLRVERKAAEDVPVALVLHANDGSHDATRVSLQGIVGIARVQLGHHVLINGPSRFEALAKALRAKVPQGVVLRCSDWADAVVVFAPTSRRAYIRTMEDIRGIKVREIEDLDTGSEEAKTTIFAWCEPVEVEKRSATSFGKRAERYLDCHAVSATEGTFAVPRGRTDAGPGSTRIEQRVTAHANRPKDEQTRLLATTRFITPPGHKGLLMDGLRALGLSELRQTASDVICYWNYDDSTDGVVDFGWVLTHVRATCGTDILDMTTTLWSDRGAKSPGTRRQFAIAGRTALYPVRCDIGTTFERRQLKRLCLHPVTVDTYVGLRTLVSRKLTQPMHFAAVEPIAATLQLLHTDWIATARGPDVAVNRGITSLLPEIQRSVRQRLQGTSDARDGMPLDTHVWQADGHSISMLEGVAEAIFSLARSVMGIPETEPPIGADVPVVSFASEPVITVRQVLGVPLVHMSTAQMSAAWSCSALYHELGHVITSLHLNRHGPDGAEPPGDTWPELLSALARRCRDGYADVEASADTDAYAELFDNLVADLVWADMVAETGGDGDEHVARVLVAMACGRMLSLPTTEDAEEAEWAMLLVRLALLGVWRRLRPQLRDASADPCATSALDASRGGGIGAADANAEVHGVDLGIGGAVAWLENHSAYRSLMHDRWGEDATARGLHKASLRSRAASAMERVVGVLEQSVLAARYLEIVDGVVSRVEAYRKSDASHPPHARSARLAAALRHEADVIATTSDRSRIAAAAERTRRVFEQVADDMRKTNIARFFALKRRCVRIPPTGAAPTVSIGVGSTTIPDARLRDLSPASAGLWFNRAFDELFGDAGENELDATLTVGGAPSAPASETWDGRLRRTRSWERCPLGSTSDDRCADSTSGAWRYWFEWGAGSAGCRSRDACVGGCDERLAVFHRLRDALRPAFDAYAITGIRS